MKAANILLVFLFLSFFSKLDAQVASMDWQWLSGGHGAGSQEGWAVATDLSGNAYVTGYISLASSASFDTITIYNPTRHIMFFVVKYSASGHALWVRTNLNTTSTGGIGQAVAVDAQGNVFVSGYSESDSIAFDSNTLLTNPLNPGLASQMGFIVKYDGNGNVLWARSQISNQNVKVAGLTLDPSGNAYVTGTFLSPLNVGSIVLSNIANNRGNYFIAKYSPTGTELWARGSTSPASRGVNNGGNLTADPAGNVYMSGFFISDSLVVGGISIHAIDSSKYNFFVAEYDSAGNVLWAKTYAANHGGYLLNIAIDQSGHLYIAGSFSGASVHLGSTTLYNPNLNTLSYLLAQLDLSGNVIWAKGAQTYASGGLAHAYSVAVGSAGDVYVSGRFSISVTFDSTTLAATTSTGDPMFLVTYSSDGNLLCAQQLASGGDDQNAIAFGPAGYAYVAGDFIGSVSVIPGDTLHASSTNENLFIGKFKCDHFHEGIADYTQKTATLSLQPNPSNGSVTISFALPEGASNKSLHITDLLGKEINNYILHDSQTEKLIDARSMSSGIYLVSLIADGGVVAVQKMVVE